MFYEKNKSMNTNLYYTLLKLNPHTRVAFLTNVHKSLYIYTDP